MSALPSTTPQPILFVIVDAGIIYIKDGALVGHAVDMEFCKDGSLLEEKVRVVF